MYTLSKHKKRGIEGFKDFVKKLELFPPATVKEMIFIGLLEDPVYLSWALKNRLSFKFFTQLEVDYVLAVYESFKNPLNLFIMAFKGSDEESEFIASKFPIPLQKQYADEAEFVKVTTSQQQTARIKIMEKVLELEQAGEIPQITWHLPPAHIWESQEAPIDESGNFVKKYDNGNIALEGKLEKRLRAGSWKHYYPNGKILAEGYYLSGERADQWIFYYPDGKIQSKGSFKSGVRHGRWEEYNVKGDVTSYNYKDGEIV